MAVYGLFYGGASYPYMMDDDDVEKFSSLHVAKASLMERHATGWDYVEPATLREGEQPRSLFFPMVADNARILILDAVKGRGKKGYNPGAHVDPIGELTLRIGVRTGRAYGVRYEKF